MVAQSSGGRPRSSHLLGSSEGGPHKAKPFVTPTQERGGRFANRPEAGRRAGKYSSEGETRIEEGLRRCGFDGAARSTVPSAVLRGARQPGICSARTAIEGRFGVDSLGVRGRGRLLQPGKRARPAPLGVRFFVAPQELARGLDPTMTLRVPHPTLGARPCSSPARKPRPFG